MTPDDEVTKEMVPEYLHPHLDVINRYHHHRGASGTHEFLDIEATSEDIRVLLELDRALRSRYRELRDWVRSVGGIAQSKPAEKVYFAVDLAITVAEDPGLQRKHGLS